MITVQQAVVVVVVLEPGTTGKFTITGLNATFPGAMGFYAVDWDPSNQTDADNNLSAHRKGVGLLAVSGTTATGTWSISGVVDGTWRILLLGNDVKWYKSKSTVKINNLSGTVAWSNFVKVPD